MKQTDVINLLEQMPNEVWSLLTKSGLELVTKMRLEAVGLTSMQRLLISKPFQVRTIQIPSQTPQGIHIQTQPQMQPLLFFMQSPELPIESTDIWYMTTAPKNISDAYLRSTSGILIGSH